MRKNENPRREFLKKTSLGGLGAIVVSGMKPYLPVEALAHVKEQALHLQPRYHRWYVDAGEEWLETNTGYARLDWTIPLTQVALVLVDVWQRHYLLDTEARQEAIMNKNLVPLMASCRKAGLKIIHAPSAPVAKKHPNWLKLVTEAELVSKHDGWPPESFRNSTGRYQPYGRPHEPREADKQKLAPLTFHPKAQPIGDEPVVASGEELHRYCKQQGILFLLFAGFNTNACILSRDYGTIQMSNRGYEVVLARDCTTGMETKETQPTLSQTNGAILLLEMFGQYSVTSGEVIAGLRDVSS